MPILAPHETYSLHIASVASASLSIIAGVVASYWFVRMKRSFRHDLIMILIGSDMFKACWFLIFPAVELVYGTIDSDSRFCNVSGFFLVMSMGASDLAVALITLHTALYIFRGEQGLYPFRKYAYPVIFIFPSLLAGLAFLNKTAYINTGQFCWLPVDPMWTRLLLSWVPRYLIFTAIVVISLSLYIYVRVLMRRFETARTTQHGSVSLDTPGAPARCKSSGITTPSNAYHRNTQSVTSSRRNSRDERGRQYSVSTMSTLHVDPKYYISKLSRKSYQSTKSKLSQTGIDETLPPYQGRQDSDVDLHPTSTSVAEELTTPPDAHLQDSQLSPTSPKATSPHSESPILEEHMLDTTGLVKTRETIRRQLRLVLIYPIAYIAMWVLPFVVHLTSYDKGAPFPMRMVSISCLCLQGFVDALIFSLKEKPWLHTRRLGHGFCWTQRGHNNGMNTNAGRTRDEMMIDGRLAKERRDRELADRRQDPQISRKVTPEWWDRDD
ncbi:hypothetical protein G7Z17_g2832 [Cylindrodendrum hubeiense]|uniref:G protein-coupled receptor GPR1 n=1 Tax=Cylindrodendrum hubeiense TaxID=595255 RepID=A0A9P5HDJ4_9HYPO|nr:hypothetical protein G7Z17_g2832 [Cylindrodendrum hubeiense]